MPDTEVFTFSCPAAIHGDDTDHVLRRVIETDGFPSAEVLREEFLEPEPNPFIRYRRLLRSYQYARAADWRPEGWDQVVEILDRSLRAMAGRGLVVTPFEPDPDLAQALGVEALWVKDETGNVGGSHKVRHLLGLILWLEVVRRSGKSGEPELLAIASCGNAALAAGIVAGVAGRDLQVFVPPDANEAIVEELERLGAGVSICGRQSGVPGDPCMHRFRKAVEAGALAFSCQGPENSEVIEGGQTLAYEMISTLLEREARLDRVLIQVGGGALAAAVMGGFEEAHVLGLIDRVPRFHTVQTMGASPLARAWERVADRLVADMAGGGEPPVEAGERAAWIAANASETEIARALNMAATHRSEFMWPWEDEPKSVADAILDDETYDWLVPVGSMLRTGGYPLTVSEESLLEAHRLAGEHTLIPVDVTGSAGLAGCLGLVEAGELSASESVAVLFTGIERGGDS